MRRLLYGRLPACAAALLLYGCSKPQEPPKFELKLETGVAGAVAYVGDKSFTLPHVFKFQQGMYLVRIEKAGYAPAWFSCRVQNDGIYTASAGENGQTVWRKFSSASHSVRLQKRGGTVLIVSSPASAEVRSGGRVLGVTPLVLADLPPGKHEVQLHSANYADCALSWDVVGSRPVIVKAELQSNVGDVNLTSVPSQARLFIDGQPHGKTPCRGPVAVGKHTVRLEMDGYDPEESMITVLPGETLTRVFTLHASPGSLIVRAAPAGAQVKINDRPAGSVPLELKDLPGGKYTVTVSLDGFDPEEREVEIVAGGIVTEEFTLKSSLGGMDLDIYPAGVTVELNGSTLGVVESSGINQTKTFRIRNLSPGKYRLKLMHKRADRSETRTVTVSKGQIARPARIVLWVPNAEIVWKDDGVTEKGIIYGEGENVIYFGSRPGIRYEIPKSKLKTFQYLKVND